MNTAALIGADIASFYLSLYVFNTVGNQPLGVACLSLFVAFLVLTVLAVDADWRILKGERNREDS